MNSGVMLMDSLDDLRPLVCRQSPELITEFLSLYRFLYAELTRRLLSLRLYKRSRVYRMVEEPQECAIRFSSATSNSARGFGV